MNLFFQRSTLHRFLFWFVGLAAFLWFVFRTGSNPKRLTYPCQQAAFPLAAGWVLSLAGLLGGGLLFRKYLRVSGVAIVMLGAGWLLWTLPEAGRGNPETVQQLPVWQVPNPVSKVFLLDSIPPTSGSLAAGDSTVPDAFLPDRGMENLSDVMAAHGTYLHKSPLHTNGIVGPDDVVLIKANFWGTGRNTTSTDRIKGLIWNILRHPDGFSGEILVFDNTQAYGSGLNDDDNNSEDPDQSIVDVVNTFRAKGYPVYSKEFTSFRTVVAAEYADGDYVDGFPYDSTTKVTYPKFRTPAGTYVSMRHGVWDSLTATYDSTRLCIISFAVLKSHVWAGATLAIKNWVGVLTTAYEEERYGGLVPQHFDYFFSPHALVARVMAVTFPRLSIIDGTWTSTNGPGNPNEVVFTNTLIASTDPAACSWYAAKFVLAPLVQYPHHSDPDFPGGSYNTTFSNWVHFLHDSAGYPCTKDSSQISVFAWNNDPVSVQLAAFSAALTGFAVQLDWMTLSETHNYGFEIQRRRQQDLFFESLPNAFIAGHGTTTIPHYYTYMDSTAFPGSWYYRLKQIDSGGTAHYSDPIAVHVITGVDKANLPGTFQLHQNFPNPFNPGTTVRFEMPAAEFVRLKVFDVAGREVVTLVEGIRNAGEYTVWFNAAHLASGVYYYQLQAGRYTATKKMVLIR